MIRTARGGATKYLTFIRSSESYRDTPPPPALMEAMGEFWPGFEGESEVRPIEQVP